MGVKAIPCPPGESTSKLRQTVSQAQPKAFARAYLYVDKGFLSWHLALREAGVGA